MSIKNFKYRIPVSITSCFFMLPFFTWAAPGQLSDVPLFLGNQVTPNVLFVIDDSGSMENELLLTQDALNISQYSGHRNSGGATSRNIQTPYVVGDRGDTNRNLLQMCVGYNALAYNPNQTYVPWDGADISDNRYGDQLIGSARLYAWGEDHSDNTNTSTRNLLGDNYGYTRWDDDGDGIFEAGECGEDIDMAGRPIDADDNPSSDISDVNIDRTHFVTTNSMSAAERTNFANWYTYYRKRRFVLNGPMLDILNDIDMRVGMATINHDPDVGREIADVNVANTRSDLIASFQSVGSSSATPLRRPLENAGRYYAGQSVSRNFVSNSTTPADPILSPADGGACQQNYTMLLTDGYSNEFDSTDPNHNVGNADGDGNTAFDGGLYADTYSNTMGDIAMHYYETDLKPDDTLYPDTVSSNNPDDTNPAQHMVTYAVAFGLTGTLPGFPVGASNWPDTSNSSFWRGERPRSLDDLLHAAYNGRGKFLSARNGDALREGLFDVVNSIITANQGSAASVGFNSTNISSDTVLYQSRFFSDNWNGTVEAFSFTRSTTDVCPTNSSLSCPSVLGNATTCDVACARPAPVIGASLFDVATVLEERVADPTLGANDRDIITFNGTQGVPFTFPANYTAPTTTELSASQIADLLTNTDADPQAFGQNIVAYLRGDNTNAIDSDNTLFRYRGERTVDNIDGTTSTFGHVLGDVSLSSPFIVGPPSEGYPNFIESSSAPYFDFLSANVARDKVVYVGANDGMLHAFNATTGSELFAYIPSVLFSNAPELGLHWLADPDYTHKSYVDSTPSSADVYDSTRGGWRTYLAGGLGAGGRGIYVLDITNPSSFSEANADDLVVMEFTHNDLGYTFATPRIAKLNNGKWAAVFGNGYAGESGDGRAKLFVVYLDGSGFLSFDTGAGAIVGADCLSVASDCNGLSSPTLVDANGDSVLDRVYAGDLHGNMWAFDLSSDDPTEWGVAHTSTGTVGTGTPEPLFSACSASPCTRLNRQPITQKPELIAHATESARSTSPNIMVLFGTGQYITENDISDTSAQTFYGVWDAGSINNNLNRSDLTEQTISLIGGNRSLTQNPVNYSTALPGNAGWYIDLPSAGERSVIEPILAGEVILFATSIPNSSPCSSGGTGFLMAADIFNGGRPNFSVFDDPSISGVAFDTLIVGATLIDDSTAISDSLGDIDTLETNVVRPERSRRTSWSIIR